MAKVHIPSQLEISKLVEICPLPEWIELGEMINDESRALLREMTIYFSSMMAIRDIQARVVKNPDLKVVNDKMMASEMSVQHLDVLGNLGSGLDSEDENEELSGVLGTIHSSTIKNPSDVVSVFIKLAEDRDAPENMIRIAASQTGIGDFLSSNQGLDLSQADDGTSGGGTAGGGANRPHASTDESVDQMLDAYLDDMPEAIPLEAYHQSMQSNDDSTRHDYNSDPDSVQFDDNFADEVSSGFSSREDKSEMALVVERNLALMPWMSNVVDYSATRNDLIETETFFNGDDIEAAQESVDSGLDLLATRMSYPTTRMDNMTTPNLTLIRSLLEKPN